jgi:dihydroorotate dehydrogenase
MRLLRDRVGPQLTLVGVGGIASVADARARLDAGATLLQAYTAFVYGGPTWPARLQRGLGAAGAHSGHTTSSRSSTTRPRTSGREVGA